MGFERGSRWTRSTLFPFPLAHGAPSASSSSSAQFPLLPLIGRALTGGERPCLRSGGSRAVLEGLNTPCGHKELSGGVKGAD
jgi:hypothetical protein